MKIFILSILLLLVLMGCNQEIVLVNTEKAYNTAKFGFSQAVSYNNLLFLSGQVGWDVNHQLTEDGSFEEQLAQSLINTETILNDAMSSVDQILMMRIYVKALDNTKKELISESLKSYFESQHQPATTLIGVETLARENLLIEIEVVAQTNKK